MNINPNRPIRIPIVPSSQERKSRVIHAESSVPQKQRFSSYDRVPKI